MFVKITFAFFLVFVCLGVDSAQPSTPPAKEKSHVERFSTPEVRAEKAEADATAKLATTPNDDVALNSRALSRIRLGKISEAFQDLSKAASIKPDNSDYVSNLGYVLWKLGKFNEAIDAERAAIKLDARNSSAHYQLGRFLLRLGQRNNLNEAVAELKRALDLDPRQFDVRFELIAAYRELGNLAEAAAQLDVLQDSRP